MMLIADEEQNEAAEGGEGAEDAAEGGEGAEGEGEEEKGGMDIRKIILFIVLPLLVLIGIGAGLYLSGMLGGSKEPVEGDEQTEEHAEEEKYVDMGPSFLELPPMIVNLATDDGNPRYLRLSVQLELRSPEEVAAVEGVLPRVIDQFQTYLRELRVQDLRGSAGIYRLQMELLSRVNQAADPVEVRDVLFQEILIQ